MDTIYLELEAEETTMLRSRTLDLDIARAEHLLIEAGIGFTEVARCPSPSCEVCDPPTTLDAAA